MMIGVDRRSSGDQSQASQEAKDRPPRRATAAEADEGRSLSANLGTESGKSRCASTALAPASAGADAHADHESAAGSGHERGPALEIQAVEQTGTSRTGKARVGSLGQSAPTGVVGTAGPDESDHRGVNRRRGAGS